MLAIQNICRWYILEGRQIGNIESQHIDFAVIIFQLKTVQPTEYCAPRGLFSRKPVRFEITAMIFESPEYIRWARLFQGLVTVEKMPTSWFVKL